MFTPYGYARQNIGDALAGTLILLWEVVNNADAFRHGPGIRSVRDSVHAVLAQKPKIQALSDAEKQRNAEIAKYGSIFFIDTCKQLRMAGDYESLRKCRDSAARCSEGGQLRRATKRSKLALSMSPASRLAHCHEFGAPAGRIQSLLSK
jgi:hypothetical protein